MIKIPVDFNSLQQTLSHLLNHDASTLDNDADLIRLGLDSMQAMAFLNQLRKEGYRITLRELYQRPTLAAWFQLLQHHHPKNSPNTGEPMTPPLPQITIAESFPLTPVQHAYLVGRSPMQPLGGVGCHLYQEFDGSGLTPERLEPAIRALIKRHAMLAVRFLAEGRQQGQSTPYWQQLEVHDLQAKSEKCQNLYLTELRERLSHRVLRVEEGETFDLQLSLLSNGRHRLHVNIDLLVLDAASFSLFFTELAALITKTPLPEISNEYDFCSYLSQYSTEFEADRQQAKAYWLAKLGNLPPAPQLPLAQDPTLITQVRFQRQSFTLSPERWRRFKSLAQSHAVTPTMALASAFAALLCRWSGSPRVLLNLTLFDRLPLHSAVDGMLADFTNILLLDMSGEALPFSLLAQQAQYAFAEAYEHRYYSGVDVLRQLKKQQSHPQGAPIVFTSNLGRPLYGDNTQDILGQPSWGISQTPQVWLDFVAFEHNDGLNIRWDSNQTLFPPGLIETLFTAYQRLINALVDTDELWVQPLPDLMPEEQYTLRQQVNDTATQLPTTLLHEGIFAQAQSTPEAIALIFGEHQISYEQLCQAARRLAYTLSAHGLQPGDNVGISVERGVGQIVAVLGILYVGGVYVPIPVDQPLSRRCTLYHSANIRLIVTDVERQSLYDWPDDRQLIPWQQSGSAAAQNTPTMRQPTDPAYIIYTSGSTGTPKGVVISHLGALNTCGDINRRHHIQADDRLLALSALHFDLSVYDIFGILSVGATLVLIDESQRRDPMTWCKLIEGHQITVWNSVPALFDMLLTFSEGMALNAPACLRLVMLSGDWIDLSLPSRYREFNPQGIFSAMGGATEASIWSNEYLVDSVAPQWRSIPYGYPLANQRFRVADEKGTECPDWVPGELWIGGAGVALGYFNQPELSTSQFVTYQDQRWYRTGDLGCYHPEGWLEFLGRRDSQVKIGGYRIELGEIDAALSQISGIRKGVALAVGEREKSLIAFIELEGEALCQQLTPEATLPISYHTLFPQHIMPSAYADNNTSGMSTFLIEHLSRFGLVFNAPRTFESCLAVYRPQACYVGLFSRFLSYLCKDGILQYTPESGYLSVSHHHADVSNQPDSPLESWHNSLHAILTGQESAIKLLDHPRLAPEQQLFSQPDMQELCVLLCDAIVTLAGEWQRPVNIFEFDARSGLLAQRLTSDLPPEQLCYVGFDRSPTLVNQAQIRLAETEHARIQPWSEPLPDSLHHQADIILLNNVLHREAEREGCINALLSLARPGALLAVLELQTASPLSLISTELLTPEGLRLRSANEWCNWFETQPVSVESVIDLGNLQAFLLRLPERILVPDKEKIRAALSNRLPGYMVPQQLRVLSTLPLTPNGKIDRKILAAELIQGTRLIAAATPLQSEAEHLLANIWQPLLAVENLDRHSDFFQAGGDSLLATRMLSEINRRGYHADLGNLFSYPHLGDFAATLVPLSPHTKETSLRHLADDEHQPFPLTEVQQAYLIGRHPEFTLSGVGAHFFIEYHIKHLDINRFNRIMNRLIARHPMLRTIVVGDLQQVLTNVPPFTLSRHRFDTLEQADELREQLSHHVLDVTRWPVFDFQLAEDGGTTSRLFVSLDNLLLDGLSMQILLSELEQLYVDESAPLPSVGVSFRDYIQHQRNQPDDPEALRYWQQRLSTLPPAPQLQLHIRPEAVTTPRFVRYSDRLSAACWQRLKEQAAEHHITPSTLLIAAYAAVISSHSSRQELTLNLTLFDRQPWHEDIDHILGDFTSLLLLAWHPQENWLLSVQRLQQQLWQDLQHRHISAIRVMRELAQSLDQTFIAMPIVFTSALGTRESQFLSQSSWLKPVWGISQTPQIWLDNQVYESDGELCLNWDAVESLFEPEHLQAMFTQYISLLRRLEQEPQAWQAPLLELLPPKRPSVVAQTEESPRTALPDGLADQQILALIQRIFHDIVSKHVTKQQNFFDAGANSLQLIQLHRELCQSGFPELVVTDLFAFPTPESLGLRCQSHCRSMDVSSRLNIHRLQQQKRQQQREKRGSVKEYPND